MESKLKNDVVLKFADPSNMLDVFDMVNKYDDGMEINRDKIKLILRDMVYNSQVILFYWQGSLAGGVAGYFFPSMLNDETMFVSMYFFVLKQYRRHVRRFIAELELAMLPTKVNRIVFAAMDQRHTRFYKMCGYTFLETHMIKKL